MQKNGSDLVDSLTSKEMLESLVFKRQIPPWDSTVRFQRKKIFTVQMI